jgi:hypothetical protein
MALSRKRRLVENEVIFRRVNKDVQQFIEDEKGHNNEEIVEFYCECSRPNCLERIKLTVKEYKALHKNRTHFTILIDHEFPEIEKVIAKHNYYQVVEKFIVPPKTEDINLALNSISESISA